MCEQKFEQRQDPQIPGKKILWIVGTEREEQISQTLPEMLESCGIHEKRIIYNNLRSKDEFPGWKNPDNRTEAELMQQAHRLSGGDCYILDYLQLVRFSTDMVTYLSMGKALFDVASSRGADCLIICLCRSGKVAETLKKPQVYDWLQVLMEDADVVFEDESLQPSSPAAGEPIQLHLQVSDHKYKIANQDDDTPLFPLTVENEPDESEKITSSPDIDHLLTVYRNQTGDEQQGRKTNRENGIGFNKNDAPILSALAEAFLTKGYLTRSELQTVSRKTQKYRKQWE